LHRLLDRRVYNNFRIQGVVHKGILLVIFLPDAFIFAVRLINTHPGRVSVKAVPGCRIGFFSEFVHRRILHPDNVAFFAVLDGFEFIGEEL